MKWAPALAVAAVVALASCAQPPPRPVGREHSPMWKSCKDRCVGLGAARAAVVETDDGRGCFCAGATT